MIALFFLTLLLLIQSIGAFILYLTSLHDYIQFEVDRRAAGSNGNMGIASEMFIRTKAIIVIVSVLFFFFSIVALLNPPPTNPFVPGGTRPLAIIILNAIVLLLNISAAFNRRDRRRMKQRSQAKSSTKEKVHV